MLQNRFLSFKYAFKGLKTLLQEETNFLIQVLIALLVIALGQVVGFTLIEWMIILICIGLVLFMEIMNTIVENLLDLYSPDDSVEAGKIKDMAAAAVLIMSVIVSIVGVALFARKLI